MSMTVLVVDDDETVRQLLSLALPLGAVPVEVVGEAADGDEAVDAARRLAPDVVILDHMMPHRSGASAIPEILEVSPRSEIVLFSAYLEAPEAGEAVRRAANAFGIESVPKGSVADLEATLARIGARRGLIGRP